MPNPVELPKLKTPYINILECVNEKGKTYISEIAKTLNSKRANVTRMVYSLQKEGMVSIENEGKYTFVELTYFGRISLWMVKEHPEYKDYFRCNKCDELKHKSQAYDKKNMCICRSCKNAYDIERYHLNAEKINKMRNKKKAKVKITALQIRNKRLKKLGKPVLERVKSEYIYQPEKPEGSVRKYCPSCNRWVFVFPDQNEGVCPKCGKSFKLHNLLNGFELVAA
jgi:DNA-binding IscR family transcriptional regulator